MIRKPSLPALFLIGMGLACGADSCRQKTAPPPQTKIDFADIVARTHETFIGAPLLAAKEDVARKRSQLQDQLLQEFERCPDCFVRKFVGAQRTLLFDAITDCDSAMRVGTLFDGGKWMCGPPVLPDEAIVYSFGIGDNISFDMDMAGMFGCSVFMFDPSPSVVTNFASFKSERPCGKGRIHFLPLGLGPVSNEEGRRWQLVIEGRSCEAKSLADIAHSLNHEHVDVLKIDIEGGEFAALQQMLSTKALLGLKVKQLLVEFHLWSDPSFADFVRIVATLKEQGFLLFRKEFNPYAADTCAEFSFVKR
jgi:FkbM family methyltransferase